MKRKHRFVLSVVKQNPIVDGGSRFACVPEKCNTESSLPNNHILAEVTYSEEERPEMSKKNKWLYPTNEFGKMEEGVVD